MAKQAYGNLKTISGGFRTGSGMRVTTTNVQLQAGSSAYRNLHSNSQYLSYGQQGQPILKSLVGVNQAVGATPGVQGEEGPQGVQGPQGNVGPAGPAGPQGPAGSVGSPGADGQQGLQGPIGNSGPEGAVGPQGPAGQNAEDADLIEFRVTEIGGVLYFDNVANIRMAFIPGTTYKFDVSPGSMAGYGLHFSNCYDGNNDVACGNDWVEGVTVVGQAGNTGAYVKIDIKPDTPTLYPWVQEFQAPFSNAYSGYGGSSSFNLTGSVITERGSQGYWEITNNAKFKGHLVPFAHDTYDIGTAEYKIRDLYVEGGSSIWVGDNHKIVKEGYCTDYSQVSQVACLGPGECDTTPLTHTTIAACEGAGAKWISDNDWVETRKSKTRKVDIVPNTVTLAGGDEAGALQFAGWCEDSGSNKLGTLTAISECKCGAGGEWTGTTSLGTCTQGTMTTNVWKDQRYLRDVKLGDWLSYLQSIGDGKAEMRDLYPPKGEAGWDPEDFEVSLDMSDPRDRGKIGADLYDGIKRKLVHVTATFADYSTTNHQYNGTGWFMDRDGIIVTSTHVVPQTYNDGSAEINLAEIYVAYSDPDSLTGATIIKEAQVAAYDYASDICILKITNPANTKYFPFLKLRPKGAVVKTGEEVYVCGHAFGALTNSLTKGVIADPYCDDKSFMKSAYTADFETFGGQSGSPVVDGHGAVVGMHGWILDSGTTAPPNAQNQGVSQSGGEALSGGPSLELLREMLLEAAVPLYSFKGNSNYPVKAGFMGIKYNNLTLNEAVVLIKTKSLPLTTSIAGARVYDIMVGSPAASVTSGEQLQLDDIIVSIDTGAGTIKVGTHFEENLGLEVIKMAETTVATIVFKDASNGYATKTCDITLGNANAILAPLTESDIRSSWS